MVLRCWDMINFSYGYLAAVYEPHLSIFCFLVYLQSVPWFWLSCCMLIYLVCLQMFLWFFIKKKKLFWEVLYCICFVVFTFYAFLMYCLLTWVMNKLNGRRFLLLKWFPGLFQAFNYVSFFFLIWKVHKKKKIQSVVILRPKVIFEILIKPASQIRISFANQESDFAMSFARWTQSRLNYHNYN